MERKTEFQREYTKDNPGCYHSLLNYLSGITSIERRKDIIIKNMNGLRQGKRLKYRSCDITVVATDGNKYSYMQADSKRFDSVGIVAEYFIVSVNKSIEEFGIKLNNAGGYQDSLGGGWYSKCHLVQHNGNYFVPDMECACG